ncbi:uncharacterized protein LOC131006026 [Salvia miltiorrhiza]|uniref:uncharacterized protein LOC131006026 n=1 Tax=Salvia miltiorrhiza TaxID=226208 RepID=UPI0025AC8D6A|nr:uncharacterized protein LOC131006026 [Salvia miltiorrhiza]
MKHATRFFISSDIQEVKDFILRCGLTEDSNNNTTADISNVSREVKSEEWLKPALVKTIKEIKNSEANASGSNAEETKEFVELILKKMTVQPDKVLLMENLLWYYQKISLYMMQQILLQL